MVGNILLNKFPNCKIVSKNLTSVEGASSNHAGGIEREEINKLRKTIRNKNLEKEEIESKVFLVQGSSSQGIGRLKEILNKGQSKGRKYDIGEEPIKEKKTKSLHAPIRNPSPEIIREIVENTLLTIPEYARWVELVKEIKVLRNQSLNEESKREFPC